MLEVLAKAPFGPIILLQERLSREQALHPPRTLVGGIVGTERLFAPSKSSKSGQSLLDLEDDEDMEEVDDDLDMDEEMEAAPSPAGDTVPDQVLEAALANGDQAALR